MKNEWWTVYGSFYGPRTFDTEKGAVEYYEEICNDDWASNQKIVHSKVIKSKEECIMSQNDIYDANKVTDHLKLMGIQDACLIALSESKRPPRDKLISLPPWRAVLIARVANEGGFISDEELHNLVEEAKTVTGTGKIENWNYLVKER